MSGVVQIAAGCGGTGRDLAAYAPLTTYGAFVTRSITLDARPGGPAPRILETPSGLVHSTGLPNPGPEIFLATELPWLVQSGVRVVVSIAGRSLSEYAELARRLGTAPGVAGVEINLFPPDAAGLGLLDTRVPFDLSGVVGAVVREVPPGSSVAVKLPTDLLRVIELAETVAAAGATSVVVGQALPAAFPDGRPAGLSGPSVASLALRCVTDLVAALPALPVVGVGGITRTADARAHLDAGAVAVQIGSALLHDPTTAARIAADLTPSQSPELTPEHRQENP